MMLRAVCIGFLVLVLVMICISELENYMMMDTMDDDDHPILTTRQLRGRYVENVVDELYNGVYSAVLEMSNRGNSGVNFTLMCSSPHPPYEPNDVSTPCKGYDGYRQWMVQRGAANLIDTFDPDIVRDRVVYKLQHVFPDSDITHSYSYAQCCDIYKIQW